jgi:hypothetical protein
MFSFIKANLIQVVLALALSTACLAEERISGVYLGASANDVILVQIVKTPDGRLAGRIEQVILQSDGRLEDNSQTIEGAADGAQITFAHKSVLESTGSATGFIDHDMLDLSWEGAHRVLKRGDAYAFEAAVTGLRAQSAQIGAEHDARSAIAVYQHLKDEIATLEHQAPGVRATLRDTETRYVALFHERDLQNWRLKVINATGNGTSAHAMRAEAAEQRATNSIEGLHGEVERFKVALDTHLRSARADLSSLQIICDRVSSSPKDDTAKTMCKGIAYDRQALIDIADGVESSFKSAEHAFRNPPPFESPARAFVKGLLR